MRYVTAISFIVLIQPHCRLLCECFCTAIHLPRNTLSFVCFLCYPKPASLGRWASRPSDSCIHHFLSLASVIFATTNEFTCSFLNIYNLDTKLTTSPDNSLSARPPCLPPLLRPCLPAAMRCEITTPTKAHLGLYHTLHHPSHPTWASAPVYLRFGSIDGPSSSYLSLPEPSSPSAVSTTT